MPQLEDRPPYEIDVHRKRGGWKWFWEVYRWDDLHVIAKAKHGLETAEDATIKAQEYCSEHGLPAHVGHPVIY